jgi:hypothetical protein
MAGPRDYTRGTTAALLTLAHGTCYYPNCSVPIILFTGGKPQPNFMTAHIRAASPNGPRYVKDMSDDERRDFSNLILLCLGHHNTVDGQDRDKYTITVLKKWKADRETAGRAELNGLREVTEDRLQQMITGALEAQVQRLNEAIDRLGKSDPDAASLLRGLATGLDPDTADMLHMAAHELKPILNPDIVDMLHAVAVELRPILNPDVVENLSNAARYFNQSGTQLDSSADTLLVLLNELSRRITELRRIQDEM